jgi:hypothetical protein
MALTSGLPLLLQAPLVLVVGGALYLFVADRLGAHEVRDVLGPVLRRLPGRGGKP